MAKYESKFEQLGFYVDGELKRFANGVYVTDNEKEITVLDGLNGVKKEVEPKPEAAPKPKAKAPAKKTSGK